MPEITIFKKGTHTAANGEKFSFGDRELDEIVESYDSQHFRAPLIITHNTFGVPDHKLADYSADDGKLPTSKHLAFGFPDKLKRVGDAIVGVFSKISPKFERLNREGAILSISSSLYKPHSPTNPYPGKWALRHIAGLGAEPPAVKGMNPLSLSELADVEVGDEFAIAFSEEDGVLSFKGAPMFDKGSKKAAGKKPNCTPGKSWSCGLSCRPMSNKNCPSALEGEPKTLADYLANQAKANSGGKAKTEKATAKKTKADEAQKETGGSLAVSKGGLARQESGNSAADTKATGGASKVDQIDRKYASANPSREDVDGWIKEQLDFELSPEGLALRKLTFEDLGSSAIANAVLGGGKKDDPLRDVKDKASFARAAMQQEREKELSRPNGYTPESLMYDWSGQIQKKKKKLESPKTKPETKAKLKKEIEEWETKERAWAEGKAAELNKRREEILNNPDARLKHFEQKFDDEVAKQKSVSEQIKKDIARGKGDYEEKAYRQILERNPLYLDTWIDLKNEDPNKLSSLVSGMEGERNSASFRRFAKTYLQDVATNSPEAALGIKGELNPASIKAAYKKAAKSAHPDAGGSKEEFDRINKAYNRLRQQYNFSDPEFELMFAEMYPDEDLEFSNMPDSKSLDYGSWAFNQIAQAFTGLREWLIDQYDTETADKVLPSSLIGILTQEAAQPEMPNWEINALRERIAMLEGRLLEKEPMPNYEEEIENNADFEEQKAELAKREAAIAARESALRKSEFTQFCENELKGKLTPAIASTAEVVAFMEHLHDNEELEFSAEKKETPLDWFKGFLNKLPKQVDFGRLPNDEPSPARFNQAKGDDFDGDSLEADNKIRQYMASQQQKGRSLSYGEAFDELSSTGALV